MAAMPEAKHRPWAQSSSFAAKAPQSAPRGLHAGAAPEPGETFLEVRHSATGDLVELQAAGLQLAETLGSLVATPVVLCSGQISDDEDVAKLRHHTRLVLPKPITGAVLIEQLNRVLHSI